MAAAMQEFTLDDCKAALNDVLAAFKQEDNSQRLEEARQLAGNDMLKTMQIFFPVATKIEMGIIEKYGFPADGDGLVRFTQAVKLYEKQDPAITQLNLDLRNVLMPPVAVPPVSPSQQNGNS
ncbi:hypothetical protein SNE40_000292 [Patella caerulea]|uniref:Protein C10 n=1 Tax=Patella caerulea TaxID=87958 RepID=A0AAN8KA81_PATCE